MSLGVAIVGCGLIGQKRAKALAGARLVACADVNALVAYYKAELPKRLDKVRAMSGEALATNIDFFGVMKQPAAACIASGCNHSVHHRAQLGTYLRSMGSKVPAIYGQSADTPMA